MVVTPTEYWQSNYKLQHITPAGIPYPEGIEILEYLRMRFRGKTILDFGCGYGRLAPAFDPKLYTGVDINPTAIEKAKGVNPGHTFTLLSEGLPRARHGLAYTVFLHIPDENISETIRTLGDVCCFVTVIEIMSRKYRRSGLPPVFNRNPDEYIKLFEEQGMRLKVKNSIPYNRYDDDLTALLFERI